MSEMIDYLNELVAQQWSTWWRQPAPALDWVLLTNGGTALHDNVVFLGVPQGAHEPALVAKTCRLPAHNQTICQEFGQLTAVWERLGEQAQQVIPRPLHLGQVGRGVVLVTDFFAGQEMTALLRYQMGQAQGSDWFLAAFEKVGGWLRQFHEETAVSHTNIPCPFAHYAALFADMFTLSDAEQSCLNWLLAQQTTVQERATKQVLLHGDFWPGNIILRSPGEKIALIDWQFSRWTSNVSHDLYFLPLASAVALCGQAETAVRGRSVVNQLQQWQKSWLPAYFESYGQPTTYGLLAPHAGFLAACVEAAARPMATFSVQQDDAVLWRTIFNQLVASSC